MASTAEVVVIKVVQNTPTPTIKVAAPAPEPNITKENGTHAIGGIGLRRASIGERRSSRALDLLTSKPQKTPSRDPENMPRKVCVQEYPRLVTRKPLSNSPQNALGRSEGVGISDLIEFVFLTIPSHIIKKQHKPKSLIEIFLKLVYLASISIRISNLDL